MTALKVNVKDSSSLTALIKKTEGEETERCIGAGKILIWTEAAEEALELRHIPLKNRIGCEITNSYSMPETSDSGPFTRVTITRGSTGWFLTEIARRAAIARYKGGDEVVKLTLAKAAVNYLTKHVKEPIRLFG